MAFLILYNGDDAKAIQDCYQAARSHLTVADRFNADACWNAGLSVWNTTATHVYQNGVWNAACYRNGTLDTGLCDEDTRMLVVNGNWARNAPDYGAQSGQPINLAQFCAFVARFALSDPDPTRSIYLVSLSRDMLDTGIEPWP